ncbi:MAG: ATP-binding cassette domain-containing protein [Novosphingobium meiothermophilum]
MPPPADFADAPDLSGRGLRVHRPNRHAAALWWLGDTAGAILFAAGLAGFIAALAEGRRAWPLLAGMGLGALVRAAAQAGAVMAGHRAAAQAKAAWRNRLVTALLPGRLLRGRLVGEDLRVAIDDVEAFEGLVARFQPLRQAAAVCALLVAAAVALASWFSALILLLTLVPFGAGMILAGLAGKAEADRQFAALSRMSGLFVDRVAALPVILAFAAEDRVTRQIGEAARDVAARTMQVLRIAFVSSAMLEFFAALAVALVAVYCGFSLLGLLPFTAPEHLTLGEAFFALALAPEFYLGMRRLAAAYHDKQQGEAAQRSMNAALEEAAAMPARANAAAEAGTAGEQVGSRAVGGLAAGGLVIAYPDGSRIGPVDADWHGPGLHVVTGESGTGKSSLLHGLLGLAPVAGGRIMLDGQVVSGPELLPLVGWAGQRPLLLPGTLDENLRLGEGGAAPAADLAPLLAASGLDAVLSRRGHDLRIDARGSGLSGGERRRIGVVRAIASGRPVLLLDEPTADLDAATGAAMVDLLLQAAQTRLVIAATHDPVLIARAASRVVMA